MLLTLLALRRRARTPGRGQRGAVAVEAALITPVLMTLVLGILEFSLIMRDYVAVSSAVRVGARIASANPGAGPATCTSTCTAPAAAQYAVDAIDKASTTMPRNSVDYVIVYQANAKGYPAPSGTPTSAIGANNATTMPAGTSATPCSTFANCVAFDWNGSRFVYTSGSWASAGIDACAASAHSAGVYLHATHANLTGMFGRTIGLGDRTVMTFEPLSAAICNSTAPTPHL
jgi:Flp pilus assembly protein TadG